MPAPQTIVAVATPPGTGGVGMVRLSGPAAIAIGRCVFSCTPPLGQRIRRVEHGHIRDADGRPIDEGLAWVLEGPASYTGEDTVEITTHGSDVILECLVQSAASHGAVLAGPGEFTRRAFVNGRIDLIEAEAVIELIQSAGRSDLSSTYGQASGRLSQIVRQLKATTIRVLARIEAGLDFSDEGDVDPQQQQVTIGELSDIVQGCVQLIDTFEGSRRRHRGFAVALVGRPNAGKSTLLNAILGEDRAIVSPIPGTTRDLVEGQVMWQGEAINLVDTAGLHPSGCGPIEEEGMRRTRQTAAAADLVIAVFDGSRPWSDEDDTVLDLLRGRRSMAVVNKQDLGVCMSTRRLEDRQVEFVHVSGLLQTGLEAVRQTAARHLPRPNLVEGIGLTRQRHHELLTRLRDRALAAVEMVESGTSTDECVAAELHEGLKALGELLGEAVDEAVLDQIFAEFCIGK